MNYQDIQPEQLAALRAAGELTVFDTRDAASYARAHLEEIFGMYGDVRSVDLPTDRQHPELTRGYAIVEYGAPDQAEDAVRHMHGGQIDGQEIQATLVMPERPARPQAAQRRRGAGGSSSGPQASAGRRRRRLSS